MNSKPFEYELETKPSIWYDFEVDRMWIFSPKEETYMFSYGVWTKSWEHHNINYFLNNKFVTFISWV